MTPTYHYDPAPDDNAALILDAEGATQFAISLPGHNKGAGAIARQLAQLLTLAQAIGSEGLTGFHTLTRILTSGHIEATISHQDNDGHRLLLATPDQQLGAVLTLKRLALPEDRRVDRLTRELNQIAHALGLPAGTDGPGIIAHISRYTSPEARHAQPA